MLSSPPPDEPTDAAALRGSIFTDLDLLAFSLEMEAAALVAAGRDDEAVRCQERRLGVRLAQRLVSGVWADEVNRRMEAWAGEYVARFPRACAPRIGEGDENGDQEEERMADGAETVPAAVEDRGRIAVVAA